MEITRIKGAEPKDVAYSIQQALKAKGYSNFSDVSGRKVTIRTIRLSDDYVKKYEIGRASCRERV